MKIGIETTDAFDALIDRLRADCDLSDEDVIANALTLFGWAVANRLKGRTIASIDEAAHAYRELSLQALGCHPADAAARRPSSASAQRQG